MNKNKSFIFLGLIIFYLFAFSSCIQINPLPESTSIGSEIIASINYKNATKALLNVYVEDKNINKYILEDWVTLEEHQNEGLITIDNSNTVSEVDKALSNAKKAIDNIPATRNEEKQRKLYELEEAYESGYLTRNTIENLFYYLNKNRNKESDLPEDFMPKPIRPEILSLRITNLLKQSFIDKTLVKLKPDATYDKIDLIEYWGVYGDIMAAAMMDTYFPFDVLYIDVLIDGILFEKMPSYYMYLYA